MCIKFKHRVNNLADAKDFNSIEIDVKYYNGDIWLGHNADVNEMKLRDFLETNKNKDLYLAINVKQSGLCDLLESIMKEFKIQKYFYFDMAVPDLIEYINKCPDHAAYRFSEFEYHNFSKCKYVWIDFFKKESYNELNDIVNFNIFNNKKIILVSPELHNLDLKLGEEILNKFYGVCTDYV
jgi:hypothetical protein